MPTTLRPWHSVQLAASSRAGLGRFEVCGDSARGVHRQPFPRRQQTPAASKREQLGRQPHHRQQRLGLVSNLALRYAGVDEPLQMTCRYTPPQNRPGYAL
jgi:hypothetical protein